MKEYEHAKLLYESLPAVYRERDDNDDLKKLLNACGLLLDQAQRTLNQRYADIFPALDENPNSALQLESQTWLLPYIAKLFDVRIASLHEEGRRQEIAKAIAWRKSKGTLNVVESVAEVVAGLEMVVHEGWKRVATTARVDKPLLPINYLGYEVDEPQRSQAPIMARHPGLPAGTPDFRCMAGAIAAGAENPAAQQSSIGNVVHRWRQSNWHGAPHCASGKSILTQPNKTSMWVPSQFDDPSVRTVDFRNSNWRQGYFHPKKVLLFASPAQGFFIDVASDRRFTFTDTLFENNDFLSLVDVEQHDKKIIIRNKTLDENVFVPIVISGKIELQANPNIAAWQFEGFVFRHTIEVDTGVLTLKQCAALAVEIAGGNLDNPVFKAKHCLIKRIQVASAMVELLYCTILTTTIAAKLNASDCIFNGNIRKDMNSSSLPGEGCVRYSAIEATQKKGDLHLFNAKKFKVLFWVNKYGDRSCGVLHPANPIEITQGAEDGGELGAFHDFYHQASQRALIEKLNRYLPAGMSSLLIPDASLSQLEGEIVNSN